ncbi:hypothetical protein JY651_50610 [Pyxidicoccus parkwayensis]|uniref:Uncharacterized protein n=1 Tax=Pyxidicoccus parkwayensis TaxID=2813578 RepID=A0ABX7P0J8_9BACT|nr:hypothetical protein [Pyxidicoccus parkwaysis]QSQ23242.1 hypothetical protein JY651_50610 [Pyxidicoccus parkwaysis]
MRLPHLSSVLKVLPGAVMLIALRAPSASAAIQVTPSGIDGGGFSTVFLKTPSGLLLGSDTHSGFHRTIDPAKNIWRPSSGGAFSNDLLSTAGMMADPDDSHTFYALNGTAPNAALMRSRDDGLTWETWRTGLIATNAGRQDGGLAEHPRSIGQLMVSAVANGTRYFFVGNYKTGVVFASSSDDFNNWAYLNGIPNSGTDSPHIRGIAVDSRGVLWVATRENGMYECPPSAYTSGASCTPDASSPRHVEEVRTVGTDVYVAADADGIMVRQKDGQWHNLSSGPLVNGQGMPEDGKGPYWVTLDVKRISSSSDVRIVAAAVGAAGGPKCPATGCAAVVWSRYSPGMATASWTGLHQLAPDSECGGRKWWEAQSDPTSMLAGSAWVPGMISIEGPSADKFLINGRTGALWRSTDVGQTWCPSVEGLGTTVNKFVSVQPSATGSDRVLVSNTDHMSFLSSNDLADVEKFHFDSLPGVNVGYASAFVGDQVFLAVDDDESLANGHPKSQLVSMPAEGGQYTSEDVPGTSTKTRLASQHVAGVAGRQVSSSQRQLVVTLGGVKPKVFLRTDNLVQGQWQRGTWELLDGTETPPMPETDTLVQLGIDKADTLYMANATGVYSISLKDSQARWTRLDGTRSPGHDLAVDASRAGRILYIRGGTVYERTPGVPTRTLSKISHALVLATSPDGSATYVATRQPDGEAQLWKYTADGADPTNITTDDWRAAGKEPRAMAVGAGGTHLYVAASGPGALVVTGI